MSESPPPVFSLLDVCQSIRKTLLTRYGSSFWVKAEMHKLNRYPASGHCFPDLLQKNGHEIVAQMRATLWRSDYERIQSLFLQTVGEPLKEGIEILFEARIQYEPQYGLSLRILDIDPAYVLGSLARERALCVQKLKEAGLWDRNRMLPFPLLPAKIALISSATSKGYSDFMQVLRQNESGYSFHVELFPALLQGDGAVPSILSALEAIRVFPLDFDAVMIIRGGGDEVGLNAYNHYALARAVCEYPIPVLSGIGHSTNLTVVEEVSYFHGITPTELAVFLLRRFEAFEAALDQSVKRMQESLSERLGKEKDALHRMEILLKMPGLRLHDELSALQSLENRLKRAIPSIFKSEKSRLQSIGKTLHWANPERNLKMGYSLTYQGDRLLFSASDIVMGQPLRTVLADGAVVSVVTETEAGKNSLSRSRHRRGSSINNNTKRYGKNGFEKDSGKK